MRSRFGVGMTPPKVLGAPKPTSSVMMSSTLGAPLGGTTRGGQYGLDCAALRLISPPNFGGGFGRYRPSIVVVAAGEPGAAAGWAGALGSGSAAWAHQFQRRVPDAARYPSSAPAVRTIRARNLVLLN